MQRVAACGRSSAQVALGLALMADRNSAFPVAGTPHNYDGFPLYFLSASVADGFHMKSKTEKVFASTSRRGDSVEMGSGLSLAHRR